MFLKTKIDEMVELIERNKKMSFYQLSRELDWEMDSIEKIALILEKKGFLKTHYPLMFLEKPWVKLLRKEEEEKEVLPQEKLLLEYNVEIGPNKLQIATVRICDSKEEKRPVYFVSLPTVSKYVKAYFEHIKDEISKELPLVTSEKTTKEVMESAELKRKVITSVIEKDLKPKKIIGEILCEILMNEMYGLGNIEIFIADNFLEEVAINASRNPVSVYHRKYGWLKTNVYLENEEEIQNYATHIARKVGRQINVLNPILDAHIVTGDRVNATLYPISSRGNTITLRMFARNPWTMIGFLKKEQNAFSIEMAALIWQAVHYEMNVIVAGGTASGKTSALNSIIALIPPYQRIVTIEDTRELMPPKYQWNWVPLVTREPNPEGLGEVTMLDLVVNSLRMRPDRIVMGEIRRKKEAEVLFEAMHTGHSVYSTIHANTGAEVLKRLIEPPIALPPSEVEDIDLVVVQYRNRRKNIRRTLEISEVVPGVKEPELKKIYVWQARTDSFQLVKPPRRYVEGLNLHTGMTEKDIEQDQKNKAKILEWMLKNNLSSVDEVGAVMNAYYTEEDTILKAAEKNLSPKKVL